MAIAQNPVTLRTKRNKEGGQTPEKTGPAFRQMTVRLPPDVHRALKIYAAQDGRSMAEIIEELVRQRLA